MKVVVIIKGHWNQASLKCILKNYLFILGDKSEPFTAFDISCDGTFICAGTHQINEQDAFLYVW